ncbi:uncharacterized protein V6R79_024951 [Siganus canaliculatus]
METGLIFVALLCLCGLSLSDECKRELLVNVDFPGTDITHLFSPDAEHCQHLCTQHPTCLFFSFLRADWTHDKRNFFCYLKSTPSGKPNVQNALLGITSGFSLKHCYPDRHPCLSQVYPGLDFPGADYRSLFTADHEECQRACSHDPQCQFFTFLEPTYVTPNYRYKCFLKFSWPIPKLPTVIQSSTRISGFSHRKNTHNANTACEGLLFPNTNIPGHDVEVLPAASPQHCQAHCSAHPLCTYFSFVSKPFQCYLKNNAAEMVQHPAAGITSGLPGHFCQLDDNWMKQKYSGIDFPHSDIRNFLTNGVDDCQRACDEDPNCQYFSFITEAISDTWSRRRCFLKRVITLPAPPRVNKLSDAVSGFSLENCNYYGLDGIQQFH